MSRHEADVHNRLRDLEDRKQKDYALAMLNIRQGIKKLEEQLQLEKNGRISLEQIVDEERRKSVTQSRRIEEIEEKRITLSSHLEKVR